MPKDMKTPNKTVAYFLFTLTHITLIAITLNEV
jgi:hypothetical protein